jgi:hypothetical protein
MLESLTRDPPTDCARRTTAITVTAIAPPAHGGAVADTGAVMPGMASGMIERPIRSTTMPDTRGVKTPLSMERNGTKRNSTGAQASDMPNMRGSPPALPASISGARNAKLVPATLSSPEPTMPNFEVCRNVPRPAAISAMLTR